MAQFTQMQISEKYDVSASDVSVAIRDSMVDAVGKVRGLRRDLKTYDEREAKRAIVDLFMARAKRYYQKYEEWVEKAQTVEKVELDA